MLFLSILTPCLSTGNTIKAIVYSSMLFCHLAEMSDNSLSNSLITVQQYTTKHLGGGVDTEKNSRNEIQLYMTDRMQNFFENTYREGK